MPSGLKIAAIDSTAVLLIMKIKRGCYGWFYRMEGIGYEFGKRSFKNTTTQAQPTPNGLHVLQKKWIIPAAGMIHVHCKFNSRNC